MTTVHRVEAKAELGYTYRYVCEHCGTDSGMRQGKVTAKKSVSLENQTVDPQWVKKLAERNLVREVAATRASFATGDYFALPGKCEACGKHQSWKAGGSWKYTAYGAIFGVIIGIVVLIAIALFTNIVLVWPLLIGLVLGGVVGGAIQLRIARDIGKSGIRDAPFVIWQSLGRYEGQGTLPAPVDLAITRAKGTGREIVLVNGERLGELGRGQTLAVTTSKAENCVLLFSKDGGSALSLIYVTITSPINPHLVYCKTMVTHDIGVDEQRSQGVSIDRQ
ncbi:MAG: hypothetical protein LBK54_08775 [Propionibacteriaceae bacterium]|nr:hypothetical protein [Propionibacteriaceae bacterium]